MAELQGGINIESYKLPICNTDEQRRNFKGIVDHGVIDKDIWSGDTSGTTETDSKTNPKDPGYTRINRLSSSR